jgi:hypothetical protein
VTSTSSNGTHSRALGDRALTAISPKTQSGLHLTIHTAQPRTGDAANSGASLILHPQTRGQDEEEEAPEATAEQGGPEQIQIRMATVAAEGAGKTRIQRRVVRTGEPTEEQQKLALLRLHMRLTKGRIFCSLLCGFDI